MTNGRPEKVKLRFRPYENELAKLFGELEAEVMKTLWKLGRARVKDLHQEISQGRRVAVTSVATTLDRLYKKGLVDRELKKGMGLYYEYKPTVDKEKFEMRVVKAVLSGLFDIFGNSTVSYLVESAEIEEKSKREEFRRLIERSRKRRR